VLVESPTVRVRLPNMTLPPPPAPSARKPIVSLLCWRSRVPLVLIITALVEGMAFPW